MPLESALPQDFLLGSPVHMHDNHAYTFGFPSPELSWLVAGLSKPTAGQASSVLAWEVRGLCARRDQPHHALDTPAAL